MVNKDTHWKLILNLGDHQGRKETVSDDKCQIDGLPACPELGQQARSRCERRGINGLSVSILKNNKLKRQKPKGSHRQVASERRDEPAPDTRRGSEQEAPPHTGPKQPGRGQE